jgi:hypothetical protein
VLDTKVLVGKFSAIDGLAAGAVATLKVTPCIFQALERSQISLHDRLAASACLVQPKARPTSFDHVLENVDAAPMTKRARARQPMLRAACYSHDLHLRAMA